MIISVGDIAVKYNVYLRGDAIELQFQSTDRSRVELAARLLKLAGVSAEVTKAGDDEWRVRAYTDRLAAGREELRKALAEIVRKAVERGWVDADRAERWLKKLEEGRVLMEGWQKYEVKLARSALRVRFSSTDPDSIERETQWLENMGLVKDVHFSVKMPEEGRDGCVSILKEGLAYIAWLSVYGEDEQQRRLAAKFVEYILERAKEAGDAVFKKAQKIIEEGRSWGSLTLEDFKKEVKVNGKTYVVKVIGGDAEFDEGRDGKTLLRIKITAEVGRVEGEHIVDRVVHEYTITYGRYGNRNEIKGSAYASIDAPGGRETDAERLAALIKAQTGKEPRIHRTKDGTLVVACGREHLDGFRRYIELADAIKKWLEETSR